MTSGKKARQRRTPAPPPVRSTGGRRASPKVLAIGAIVIAVAAVGAALAFALTGGSSGSTSTSPVTVSKLPDAAASVRLFRGIPQHNNVLGKPNAPVTMVEYVDLQCPICRVFETEVMPSILQQYVRTGKLRVVARPLAFINPAENSQRGRLAALAAGKQYADGARRQDGRRAHQGEPRRPRPGDPGRASSVAVELVQALIADAEMVRDLMQHHAADLGLKQRRVVAVEPLER